MIEAHWASYVLDVAVSHVLEGAIDPIAHLVAHNPADTDAPRFRQPLQPCRNIDAVAKDVVLFNNHIAEVDPDAEPDPTFFWHVRFAVNHPALDLHGAADGIDDTRKLRKQTVAGVLYDPAPVLGDFRLNQLAKMSLEAFVRSFLIRPH
jgi:hypothetical protein